MKDSELPSGNEFPLTKNSGKPSAAVLKQGRTAKNGPIFTRSHNTWTYTRRALAVLFCLFCAMSGTIAGNFYWKSPMIRAMVNGMIRTPFQTLKGDPLASFTPELQLPPDKQHTINVLLLGCDADYESRRPVAIKGAQTRSDAILVAHVDFDAQTINVLSIPRDTAVQIPHHGYSKINAAHAFGGAELSQETIKSVFGIDTDYYLTLNFDGFVKVVDALGGVDLEVHKNLNYDDNWGNLHIHLKPGRQHLNGYHAMGYVRIRHSDDDIQRTIRQQEFLEALRSKVKSPKNILKLPDALNAVMDNVKSNMTQEQMITLANFARKLKKDNIQVATLPCIEGPSYVYMKGIEAQEVIRKLFYNDDKFAIVTVNAPTRMLVQRLNDRAAGGKRRRSRHAAAETTGPKNDDGEPLVAGADADVVDDKAATPDGGTTGEPTTAHSDKTDTPPDEQGTSDTTRPTDTQPDAPAPTGKPDKTDTGDSSGKSDGGKKDAGKPKGRKTGRKKDKPAPANPDPAPDKDNNPTTGNAENNAG